MNIPELANSLDEFEFVEKDLQPKVLDTGMTDYKSSWEFIIPEKEIFNAKRKHSIRSYIMSPLALGYDYEVNGRKCEHRYGRTIRIAYDRHMALQHKPFYKPIKL
jgi:hypothetical protein